ncbi:MAG: sulfate ABC transporter permease subunit CysW [Janthinobacterium lividum]
MQGRLGLGEGPAWRALLIGGAVLVAVLLLILPLAVLFTEAFAGGMGTFIAAVTDPDAAAAVRLTLVVAAIVVPANTVFGVAAAWCVTRFRFRGRRLLQVLIGLPFSVSPIISGLVYVLMFGAQGWFGPALSDTGLRIIFALPGIVLATLFVTLPFVAGQLIPLMEAQGIVEEEAALVLGATGLETFLRITLPKIRWGLLFGVLLCSARSMGEFGAVSVVSGRIRGLTNTVPLHIEVLYQEYDIAAAFGVATLLAGVALLTIGLRALLDWRQEALRARGSRAQLLAVAA